MKTKRVSKYLIEALLIQFLRDMGMHFDKDAPSHQAALAQALKNYEGTE